MILRADAAVRAGSAGDATTVRRTTHAGHDAFQFLARCIGTKAERFARTGSTGLRGADTAVVARAVDGGLDLTLRRGFCIVCSGLLGLGGCCAASGATAMSVVRHAKEKRFAISGTCNSENGQRLVFCEHDEGPH